MQYTRLGDSGLLVSRLSFGTVTFGTGMATVSKVDQEQAMAMIDRCLEAGINFFDTADAYSKGQSEEMLGRALGDRRHGVLIGTKAGFRMGDAIAHAGLSRRHLIAAVEASLKRLGTDYIDVFHAHRTDPYTPLDETLEALDYLVRQGMVRYVGYSNWPAWTSAEAVATQRARGWARFVSAQMYYSLVARPRARDCAVPALCGRRAHGMEPTLRGVPQWEVHPRELGGPGEPLERVRYSAVRQGEGLWLGGAPPRGRH